MKKTRIYIVDANVLINMNSRLPYTDSEHAWKELIRRSGEGEFRTSAYVREEVRDKQDELKKFTIAASKMFVLLEPDHAEHVPEIMSEFPLIVKPADRVLCADPFVIGLARYYQDSGCNVTLFTDESRTRTATRIPVVCQRWNIIVAYTDDLLRELQ